MKLLKIIYWMLLSVVTMSFLLFGLLKVIGNETMLKNMQAIHYSTQITKMIGFIELTAVVGLFFSKYRLGSLLVFLLILSGAIGSHLGAGQALDSIIIPSAVALLTAIIFIIHIKINTIKNS